VGVVSEYRATRPRRFSLTRLSWNPDLAAALVALVQFTVLYGLGARGGWFADDFANLSQAQSARLNRTYLENPIFSHPIPGSRLINWLVFHLAPMNYAVAYLLPVLGVVITGFMVHRTLTVLTGRSWATVGFAAVVGSTAIWLPPAMWFAAGPQMVFSALAGVLTAHAVACCYRAETRGHTIGWGVLAAFWTLTGLAFYEIVTMTSLATLALTAIAGTETFRPRALVAVVRRAWAAYLLIPLVVGGYLALYLSRGYVTRHPGYTFGSVLHFILDSWVYTLGPGLLGGPLRWGYGPGGFAVTETPLGWRILVQLLLLALLVLTVRRSGWRAVWAWGLLFAVFAAAQYVVASARLQLYGLSIARETRYTANAIAFSALCVGVALLARQQRRTGDRPRQALTLVPGLSVVIALVSAVPVASHWVHSGAQTYLTNFRRSLHQAERDPRFSLYDTTVRSDVEPADFVPYAYLAAIARLYSGHPISVDDPSRRLYVVDDQGFVRVAGFDRTTSLPAHCWSRTDDQFRYQAPAPSRSDRHRDRFVRFHYRGPAGASVHIALIDDSPAQGEHLAQTVSTSGTGEFLIALHTRPIRRLEIRANAGVCLDSGELGYPVVPSGGQ